MEARNENTHSSFPLTFSNRESTSTGPKNNGLPEGTRIQNEVPVVADTPYLCNGRFLFFV
jgi:hypothetical protein